MCNRRVCAACHTQVLQAYHLCPNFDLLVPALLEAGPFGLADRHVHKNLCAIGTSVALASKRPLNARLATGVGLSFSFFTIGPRGLLRGALGRRSSGTEA
jgi:hypothetical protein